MMIILLLLQSASNCSIENVVRNHGLLVDPGPCLVSETSIPSMMTVIPALFVTIHNPVDHAFIHIHTEDKYSPFSHQIQALYVCVFHSHFHKFVWR